MSIVAIVCRTYDGSLASVPRAHVVIGVVIAVLTTLGAGRLVSAHTDFDSSTPTDGAVVDGPLRHAVPS